MFFVFLLKVVCIYWVFIYAYIVKYITFEFYLLTFSNIIKDVEKKAEMCSYVLVRYGPIVPSILLSDVEVGFRGYHKACTNMASYQGRYLSILKQWNGRNSRSLMSQSYVVHIKHVMSLVSYLRYFVPEHKQANFT